MTLNLSLLHDTYKKAKFRQRNLRSPAICMFHSISEGGPREWGPWQYSLTPAQFEQQIAWLSENMSVVPIERVVAYLCGETTIPENAVVLSFDDGYEDFISNALPILRTYEVPSTLYVSTYLMRKRGAPYEFRLGKTLIESHELTFQFDNQYHTYDLATDNDLREAYNEIRSFIIDLPPEQRESFLTNHNIHECRKFFIMSPETVQSLGEEQLVTVGSHGHFHRRFGSLSRREIKSDIRTSLSELSALLGCTPDHFSFPYGSYSRTARQVVKEMGLTSAVTTYHRRTRPRDWNRCYSLPRIDMSVGNGAIPSLLKDI